MKTNTLRFPLLSGILFLSFALFGGCNKDGPATAPSATDNSSPSLQKGTPPANPAIAFSGLTVMNADGTNLKALFFSGTIPAWSPDGRHIALYTGPYAQPWGISVADISVVNGVPKASNIRFLVAGMRQEWSPLGNEIAYGNQTENQILVVPATGGTPTALYTVPSGNIVRDPTWRSDGSKIAFVEINFPPGTPSQFFLKVLDRASGVVSTVLSTGHDYLFNPEWARTSDVLAYERYIGGVEKIYTLNLATGATSFIVNGYYPSWSPDDTKLVYSTGSAINTITLTTGAVKLLKTSTGSFLAWKR